MTVLRDKLTQLQGPDVAAQAAKLRNVSTLVVWVIVLLLVGIMGGATLLVVRQTDLEAAQYYAKLSQP